MNPVDANMKAVFVFLVFRHVHCSFIAEGFRDGSRQAKQESLSLSCFQTILSICQESWTDSIHSSFINGCHSVNSTLGWYTITNSFDSGVFTIPQVIVFRNYDMLPPIWREIVGVLTAFLSVVYFLRLSGNYNVFPFLSPPPNSPINPSHCPSNPWPPFALTVIAFIYVFLYT